MIIFVQFHFGFVFTHQYLTQTKREWEEETKRNPFIVNWKKFRDKIDDCFYLLNLLSKQASICWESGRWPKSREESWAKCVEYCWSMKGTKGGESGEKVGVLTIDCINYFSTFLFLLFSRKSTNKRQIIGNCLQW